MQATADIYQFMLISILAGSGVLIPRAETELLGRTAIGLLPERGLNPVVIDMRCGSGNLGLAIADARSDAQLLLSDLTDETTAQARLSATRLGFDGRGSIGQGDMFAGLSAALDGARADLIVCNPPYISTAKLAGDSAYLLEKGPRAAFDARADGIVIHQRLIAEAPQYLKAGGGGWSSNSAQARTVRSGCCSGATAPIARSVSPTMNTMCRASPMHNCCSASGVNANKRTAQPMAAKCVKQFSCPMNAVEPILSCALL
ncbi:MAG: methyltransferase [Candidatus Devosia euplotis]|nr:methyltransferase [Candidatus Devosia euplotis]